MSFADDVARFKAKVEQRAKDIHDGVCDEAFKSIVDGSQLTGAPGQPVQSGVLRGSWQNLITGPLERRIVSGGAAAAYNYQIEDGTREGRALTLRSPVGGFHSVKLTVLGWRYIVEYVTRKVVGNA